MVALMLPRALLMTANLEWARVAPVRAKVSLLTSPRRSCLSLLVFMLLQAGHANVGMPTLHIDAGSWNSLLAHESICGDSTHSTSCLDILPCERVNVADCSDDDPVYIPQQLADADPNLWRSVLPLPTGPHPHNLGADRLGDAAGRLPDGGACRTNHEEVS